MHVRVTRATSLKFSTIVLYVATLKKNMLIE